MNRAARKRPHRVLLEEDITSMLQDDDDSEDGLDFDDDSLADPDFSPELETFEDNTSTLDIDVDSIIETLESNHESSVPSPPSAETASHGPLPSSAQSNQSNKTATKPTKLNLRWKKKSLQVNSEQLRFKGNMNLGTELLELETPIQFFFYLFPQELIKMISEETNLYQVQNDPNSTFRVTEIDIRQFMGVVYLMSLIRLPRVTNHWNPILGTPIIQDTMPLNKFEKVRQTLHFNDNSKNLPRNDPGYDRIFKIRPVVESLNAAYKKVPLEEHLCVDEQMCSTKARNVLKRYNPQKPHKWGYKIYVLSGVSGYAYKTEIETGKENITLPEEPDLGAASNVVMRLARLIPRHQNYQLYFDNYFTSLRLLEYLAKEGIHSLGTIRRNRIPDCKLQPEKILLKKPRGHSEEYVADVNGTDISNVAWKDNKIVTLVSTFAGIQPETDVRRWDKQNSRFMEKFRFPGIIGCIDGTHVALIRPIDHEEAFFNRKNYHSLNVLIICDSNLNILHVDASFGGAAHDSYVWNQCHLKAHLERLERNRERCWLISVTVCTTCAGKKQQAPPADLNFCSFNFNSDVRARPIVFMEKFRFPGIIGCIDGTHVALIRPIDHEEAFFNRKNYHSLNVLIICDSNLNILHVDVSFGGAAHDSYV
ncbi:hypothetical protein PYW07_009594 [Mythimna separata]|uniref:Transposase n=1 Tax=Mythimna separata TaxID=271217 RepID=A0AAD7YCT5_MYTSE|nr:hypothetical protein PYW07_009594 [Mythimna separata]